MHFANRLPAGRWIVALLPVLWMAMPVRAAHSCSSSCPLYIAEIRLERIQSDVAHARHNLETARAHRAGIIATLQQAEGQLNSHLEQLDRLNREATRVSGELIAASRAVADRQAELDAARKRYEPAAEELARAREALIARLRAIPEFEQLDRTFEQAAQRHDDEVDETLWALSSTDEHQHLSAALEAAEAQLAAARARQPADAEAIALAERAVNEQRVRLMEFEDATIEADPLVQEARRLADAAYEARQRFLEPHEARDPAVVAASRAESEERAKLEAASAAYEQVEARQLALSDELRQIDASIQQARTTVDAIERDVADLRGRVDQAERGIWRAEQDLAALCDQEAIALRDLRSAGCYGTLYDSPVWSPSFGFHWRFHRGGFARARDRDRNHHDIGRDRDPPRQPREMRERPDPRQTELLGKVHERRLREFEEQRGRDASREDAEHRAAEEARAASERQTAEQAAARQAESSRRRTQFDRQRQQDQRVGQESAAQQREAEARRVEDQRRAEDLRRSDEQARRAAEARRAEDQRSGIEQRRREEDVQRQRESARQAEADRARQQQQAERRRQEDVQRAAAEAQRRAGESQRQRDAEAQRQQQEARNREAQRQQQEARNREAQRQQQEARNQEAQRQQQEARSREANRQQNEQRQRAEQQRQQQDQQRQRDANRQQEQQRQQADAQRRDSERREAQRRESERQQAQQRESRRQEDVQRGRNDRGSSSGSSRGRGR